MILWRNKILKKKVRDISINDIIKLCKKYTCSDCPMAPYLCFDCSEFRDFEKEVLEAEIEVPENE